MTPDRVRAYVAIIASTGLVLVTLAAVLAQLSSNFPDTITTACLSSLTTLAALSVGRLFNNGGSPPSTGG